MCSHRPKSMIMEARFKSSHPGVKPPTRTGTPTGPRLQPRSSGESFTKSALCLKSSCRNSHCPARDLHGLSYIAEQLQETPETTVHHLKDKPKGWTYIVSGETARTSGENGPPHCPRKKLVKKNPHEATWTIVRPAQSVVKERQEEREVNGNEHTNLGIICRTNLFR